jgi:hypothetical protein
MKSNAEYINNYRKSNPSYTAKNRLRNKARNRALEKLKNRHFEEFQKLFMEESRNLEDEAKNSH